MPAGVDLALWGCDAKAQATALFSAVSVHSGASSALQGFPMTVSGRQYELYFLAVFPN